MAHTGSALFCTSHPHGRAQRASKSTTRLMIEFAAARTCHSRVRGLWRDERTGAGRGDAGLLRRSDGDHQHATASARGRRGPPSGNSAPQKSANGPQVTSAGTAVIAQARAGEPRRHRRAGCWRRPSRAARPGSQAGARTNLPAPFGSLIGRTEAVTTGRQPRTMSWAAPEGSGSGRRIIRNELSSPRPPARIGMRSAT